MISGSDALVGKYWCHMLDSCYFCSSQSPWLLPAVERQSDLLRFSHQETAEPRFKGPLHPETGDLGSNLGRGLNEPHWPLGLSFMGEGLSKASPRA